MRSPDADFRWLPGDGAMKEGRLVFAETLTYPAPPDREQAAAVIALLSRVMLGKAAAELPLGNRDVLQADVLRPAPLRRSSLLGAGAPWRQGATD